MKLNTIVKQDGTLMAKIPESLWGKHVSVTIQEKKPKQRKHSVKQIAKKKTSPLQETDDNRASLAQWEHMKTALQEIDALNLPEREFADILTELRTFKETL